MADKTAQGDASEESAISLGATSNTSEAQPGTLTLTYTSGVPAMTVSGGNALPARIDVVSEDGRVVAAYTAGPAPKGRNQLSSQLFLDVDDYWSNVRPR
ncbi:hypothetical protein [Streptomyces sp. NPDC056399]|uniref:hypothetical protein n=1 Tax=Streptomyces sp. NPDC056399 TaxID=3345807 RepID=UPI0035E2A303